MSKAILKSNVEACFGELREEMAKRLLVAGITLANEHQKMLSVGNPAPHNNPSKPGEYPKLRTGFGRANITAWPMSVSEVERKLSISIGVREAGWYVEYLADAHGRLGLLDTFNAMRSRLEATIGKQA